MNTRAKKGKVYLVGAGPGRSDLITLRGLELLKKADCVIYDKLANPALLRYARADAELIATPKRTGGESFTQQQINKLLVEKAGEHKVIVRLKGGDPYIFGRGTEEAKWLADNGIDFEVVPGVTAAIAASAYAGIALTDRDFSSQVAFITGHEAEGKQQSSIDWENLANFSGTLCFYMAMENFDFIVDQLTSRGLSPDTPAAVITDATQPTQRTAKATLATIAGVCKSEKIGAPAIIVIGTTAKGDSRLEWLAKQPLFGKTIVITRDAEGNAELADKIADKMGLAIELPVTKLKPLTDSTAFLKALSEIKAYEWVIFTSATGVEQVFGVLAKLNKDGRVFGSARIAAIGRGTARELARFGIRADFVPTTFTSKVLARELIETAQLRGRKVLLLRSKLASDELPCMLAKAGAVIENVPVYTQEKNLCDLKNLSEMLAEKRVNWLVFASPFAATCFYEQVPVEFVKSSNAKIASIGPVTTKRLTELGVRVDIEPAEHTIDGLLTAIEQAEAR
ncbi:MAG: uroporphyrinogen-III C-methyltransferase [Sedimentisphaerales bacterium]